MLKLLKYDWKRNANLSLGLLAVLVFLQIVIGVVGNVRGWEQSIIFVLSFMLYTMTGIILIIIASKTFENNIKAYSRRLLPVRPVWTAVSSIVLWWLFTAVLAGIALLHYYIYVSLVHSTPVWPEGMMVTSLLELFKFIFAIFWTLTYLMLMILLSMTIGASVSLRGKAGTWVGIIAFFIIQYVLSLVESALFGGFDAKLFSIGIIQSSNDSINAQVMSSAPMLQIGQLLFDGAMFALMLLLINYLLSKKVEI
ncbi:hypothetical protein [Paenibacillus humicus]|uniref:hypothetical protein n=1 Tax=Paenibacillus humicus TaxID=412861 RepID=UPI003D2AC6F8